MLKLLIVDDEIDICDFVKNFFKERNFDVITAYNGKEALSIIGSENPDIILLDLRMPVMDGMSVLRSLRKKNSDKKVIIITALEDGAKAEEAKRYGITAYITKPLLLEQLERTVLTAAEQIKMKK